MVVDYLLCADGLDGWCLYVMVLLLVLFCLVYCLPIVLWFEGFKFGCLGVGSCDSGCLV